MPGPDRAGLHARRPEATTLEVIPEAGRDVHLDQPERLHGAIVVFLRG